MNYIKKLEAENAQMKANELAVENALIDLRMRLNGAKFSGIDSDGGRKDWMSVSDIYNELNIIENALHFGADDS